MNKKKIKNQILQLVEESKETMTKKEQEEVKKSIRLASLAAAGVGAGLAQLPGSDAPILVTIQISLIQKLGRTFNKTIKDSSAETIIATSLSTFIGRGLSQFLAGWIPLAGNIINAGTAALITELLGWIVANEFAKKPRL